MSGCREAGHSSGVHDAREVGKFSNGEVPQDMTQAFSVWWAGGGSDVKLVRKGQALVVLQRFKDEGIDPRKERDVEVARFALPPQVRGSGLEPEATRSRTKAGPSASSGPAHG
ncbi:hypothetical protein [Myxococcus qinghaiensis]|uniref:hypothetical protein n=1 Tax=Myxococcus qinghaiensis TaxID=2906758 RepID=UPI0020A794F0|nr:hypothetical protein [Myxococcus qinghaiensis]MCP3163935.1 hypothetical protein [Myxococcus qinghaiensis]